MNINELNFLIKHICRNWIRSLSNLNISENALQIMVKSFIRSEYRYCAPGKTILVFGLMLNSYNNNMLTHEEMNAFNGLHQSCKLVLNDSKTPASIKEFAASNKKYLHILWHAAKYNRNIALLKSNIGAKIQNDMSLILKSQIKTASSAKSLVYSVVFSAAVITSVLICFL